MWTRYLSNKITIGTTRRKTHHNKLRTSEPNKTFQLQSLASFWLASARFFLDLFRLSIFSTDGCLFGIRKDLLAWATTCPKHGMFGLFLSPTVCSWHISTKNKRYFCSNSLFIVSYFFILLPCFFFPCIFQRNSSKESVHSKLSTQPAPRFGQASSGSSGGRWSPWRSVWSRVRESAPWRAPGKERRRRGCTWGRQHGLQTWEVINPPKQKSCEWGKGWW